jgi:hypothetical protein
MNLSFLFDSKIIIFLVGMLFGCFWLLILYLVYLWRTTSKNTTYSDLQQIKSIVENKTNLKLIKGIEIVDLDDDTCQKKDMKDQDTTSKA